MLLKEYYSNTSLNVALTGLKKKVDTNKELNDRERTMYINILFNFVNLHAPGLTQNFSFGETETSPVFIGCLKHFPGSKEHKGLLEGEQITLKLVNHRTLDEVHMMIMRQGNECGTKLPKNLTPAEALLAIAIGLDEWKYKNRV